MIAPAGESMPDIVNPYIVGNPVTGLAMFFGREDVFQFIHQTLIGQYRDNVIVLYGQMRTGKTSVLYQMRSHLDDRYLCIFVDMHGFVSQGLGSFLWGLANHMQRILRRDYQIQIPLPKRTEFMADPHSFFENEVLGQLRTIIGNRHILLMMDEVVYLQEQVRAGKLEQDIFEYIRHLMQHYEWLNFLFSLSSGLEELEKEYAFLFNVGLYKKISFLDRKAANNLITQPVKEHYQIESSALEYIYHITSGHPYYTQLLCHCLFNRWRQQRMALIQVQDVKAVIDEALERGSAVLKYSWEELMPGEKAVIAGMAAAMGQSNTAVDSREVDRSWQRYNVSIPIGEQVRAIRNLIAKDFIVGQEKFAFTINLQRLWVQKHRRIEWVKEEIANFPFEEPRPSPLPWSTNSVITRLLTFMLVLLFIAGSSGLFYTQYYLPNLQHANATATATAQAFGTSIARANATVTAAINAVRNPYLPYQGTLAVNDPLYDNSRGYQWDEESGNCQFPGDGYHVFTAVNSYTVWCAAFATNFRNFVYQAQMTILKGTAGGLIFRADANNSKLYDFQINRDGYFYLFIYTGDPTAATKLEEGQISNFHKGLGQSNLIAVAAQDDYITLYTNRQYVTRVTDSTLGQGQIGCEARDDATPTQVVFAHAKVWKLP
jgi:ATPase domain predominantly from Archaea